MESIGQKLSAAREALGFSIEQIARETNIAKSYLAALEQEDFDSFPGETYLLGFLRNYSEYLNLDPGEMILLYRNMKIQEQPSPMEELLVGRKPIPRVAVIIIIIVLILGLGAAGYFYIYPEYIEGRPPAAVEEAEEEPPKADVPAKVNVKDTYEFSDEVIERRFRKNDGISVRLGDQNFLIAIADIGDAVTFVHPQGELIMKSGEEALLDLDGNGGADIRMLLRSLDSAGSSIVLHIDRFVQASGITQSGGQVEETAVISPAVRTVADENAGRAGAPSRVVKTVVVREASAVQPFTLNIVFRGYCLFRYESDRSTREERYFNRGETFRLDVNSEVSLWASNAGAMSGKINGVDIDLGGSGEVTSRTIRWVYNTDNSVYELQIIPLY